MKVKMLENGKTVDFKYVVSDPDPRGNERIYFRPPNRRKRRMRSELGSRDFAAEYLDLWNEFGQKALVQTVAAALSITEGYAREMIAAEQRRREAHGEPPPRARDPDWIKRIRKLADGRT